MVLWCFCKLCTSNISFLLIENFSLVAFRLTTAVFTDLLPETLHHVMTVISGTI